MDFAFHFEDTDVHSQPDHFRGRLPKGHIFFLSLTVSLFQGHVADAGHDLERKTQRENHYVALCSNATRKKKKVKYFGRKSWGERGVELFLQSDQKSHTCCSLQYANSIIRHQHFYTATQSNIMHVMEIGVPMQGRCVHSFFCGAPLLWRQEKAEVVQPAEEKDPGTLHWGLIKKRQSNFLHRQDRGQEGIVLI